MISRVRTRIPNLDLAISGEPGTGKAVFGMKSLLYGAVDCGKPGVLASFTESKKVLVQNMKRHPECGMDDLKKIQILNFVRVKERLPTPRWCPVILVSKVESLP